MNTNEEVQYIVQCLRRPVQFASWGDANLGNFTTPSPTDVDARPEMETHLEGLGCCWTVSLSTIAALSQLDTGKHCYSVDFAFFHTLYACTT